MEHDLQSPIIHTHDLRPTKVNNKLENSWNSQIIPPHNPLYPFLTTKNNSFYFIRLDHFLLLGTTPSIYSWSTNKNKKTAATHEKLINESLHLSAPDVSTTTSVKQDVKSFVPSNFLTENYSLPRRHDPINFMTIQPFNALSRRHYWLSEMKQINKDTSISLNYIIWHTS